MKEIGEQFKEKRESIGISIEEVCSDLGIDEVLIDNLEAGNNKVFKDILELKDIVVSYAKYLGLDSDAALDELNDYLFEKTSKISIDEINKELSKIKDKEKEIKSPYTIDFNDKNKNYGIVLIIIVILVVLGLFYLVLKKILIG